MILRIDYGLPLLPGAPRLQVADVIDQPHARHDQAQNQEQH
jgi:hypothetical protein